LEGRRTEDLTASNRRIERGWFVGNAEFRRELLEQVGQAPGASHYGETVQEAEQVSNKCQFSLFKLLTVVAGFWQVGGHAATNAP
jgi:hypothetical protein